MKTRWKDGSKTLETSKNAKLSKARQPQQAQSVIETTSMGASQAPQQGTPKKSKSPNSGARNLVILGVASTLIALLTSSVAIAIYHNSGDIYLDRSRPGFLPDDAEVEEKDAEAETESYSFPDSGAVTSEVIDEYLEHLEALGATAEKYSDPFSSSALSDESLGIPEAETETPDAAE